MKTSFRFGEGRAPQLASQANCNSGVCLTFLSGAGKQDLWVEDQLGPCVSLNKLATLAGFCFCPLIHSSFFF